MRLGKTRRWCWNLPLKNFQFEVLRCENSNATQLLAIFVLNTTPQFAFTIVFKQPVSNEDIFIETIILHLNNLPRTKTIYHVVCGDFNINLLSTSFTASRLMEFMENYDFSLKIREPTRQRRISSSLIGLCSVNFTFYCDGDQADITDHLSV